MEVFRRRGIEVLYLTDPVDEFVMSTLGTYDGKPLVSIDAADVELPPEPEKATTEAESEAEKPAEPASQASRPNYEGAEWATGAGGGSSLKPPGTF